MKNLGISGRFSIVILVFTLTVGGVFGFGLYNLTKVRASAKYLQNHVHRQKSSASTLLASVFEASAVQKDLLLTNDPVKDAQFTKEEQAAVDRAKVNLERLKDVADETISKQLNSVFADFNTWLEASREVNALAAADKDAEGYKVMLTTSEPVIDRIEKSIGEIVSIVDEHLKQEEVRDEEVFQSARLYGIVFSLIGLALGITQAILTIRSITKAVGKTVDILSETAHEVASASGEIARSSQNLSDTATQQASSLEQTSAAVEQMNSMVARNAEAARESTEIAQTSVEAAQRGQTVVDNMMRSMEEINLANKEVMKQTDESNRRIAEIVQVIDEIGSKTKIINEIVFQTKLLSFNASVEAARAGEHGKGFAVVAEEVGNLAQMSGNAAKDITSLLDGSIQRVQGIVSDSKTRIEKIIQENNKKVESGTRIAAECKTVLGSIVQGISSVSQMVQSVAGASDEQARGVNEINRAIIQLDQVTQSNAAASEEAAAASEELSAQAAHMKAAVGDLIAVVNGGRSEGVRALEQPAVSPRSRAKTAGDKLREEPRGKTKSAASVTKKSNVIRLGAADKPSKAPMETMPRLAAGGEEIPLEDDPRFKDI